MQVTRGTLQPSTTRVKVTAVRTRCTGRLSESRTGRPPPSTVGRPDHDRHLNEAGVVEPWIGEAERVEPECQATWVPMYAWQAESTRHHPVAVRQRPGGVVGGFPTGVVVRSEELLDVAGLVSLHPSEGPREPSPSPIEVPPSPSHVDPRGSGPALAPSRLRRVGGWQELDARRAGARRGRSAVVAPTSLTASRAQAPPVTRRRASGRRASIGSSQLGVPAARRHSRRVRIEAYDSGSAPERSLTLPTSVPPGANASPIGARATTAWGGRRRTQHTGRSARRGTPAVRAGGTVVDGRSPAWS
jgi:hypothetical protein